jgi:hypothetical protein
MVRLYQGCVRVRRRHAGNTFVFSTLTFVGILSLLTKSSYSWLLSQSTISTRNDVRQCCCCVIRSFRQQQVDGEEGNESVNDAMNEHIVDRPLYSDEMGATAELTDRFKYKVGWLL